MAGDPEDSARALLDVAMAVMRRLRSRMRENRDDLSVAQFRTLITLRKHPGASLAEIAEALGLAPATASSAIDGLVTRGLVARATAADDRRRVAVRLTADGESLLAEHRAATQHELAEALSALDPTEQAVVRSALDLLVPLLSPGEADCLNPAAPGEARAARNGADP